MPASPSEKQMWRREWILQLSAAPPEEQIDRGRLFLHIASQVTTPEYAVTAQNCSGFVRGGSAPFPANFRCLISSLFEWPLA
jgi:hypothetical protein